MMFTESLKKQYDRADKCESVEEHEQITKSADIHAIQAFSSVMAEKMLKSYDKGRGGWHNTEECSDEFLCELLIEHINKGNEGTFIDIANFCMMLYWRDADPKLLKEINNGL